MRWTDEQQAAILAEGNLIVSAAAGAGKTAVLTERIVSRVRAGTPIDKLLVLTYTRAAATEMKTRIARRLHALALESESGEAAYLRRQAQETESGYISTVHAFCARVLRRHYPVLGLSASARTADDMETAALTERVRDELLTQLSAEENKEYQTLLAAFGSEQAVWDAAIAVYRFTRAQIDPDGWLMRAAARYETGAAQKALLADAVRFCQSEIRLVIETVERARDALPLECAGPCAVLDEDRSRYRALLLCPDYETYRESVFAMAYSLMRFPNGTADSEKKPAQAARQLGKDLIAAQKKRLYQPEADALETLRRSGAVVEALALVTRRFEDAYAAAKQSANLQDYDDLEHRALAALSQERVAAEYRDRFQWIFVDEYQDSNRVQEEIVRRVSRGDNLFFVGDVKQSIYRFRQAEPELFLEKLAMFTGERGQRIDLTCNFRSSEEVLSSVNETFAAVLTQQTGGLDYDERARLNPGGAPPPGGAELHLIERTRAETDDEEDDALESAADLEVEARLIASRIREILQGEPYFDAKTNETRPYRYADFAVLLRAGTDAQLLAQTLAQEGIPSYAQASGGYFDAIEVQVLRNLLRVIDNRRQDVALLSVLCSSIGGFTAEELARMRAKQGKGSFYDCFAAYAGEEGALAARAKTFLARLDEYREESRLIPTEALIGKLLDETGFYEEMGAGYGGAQRQANLNALLDKAHAFEESGQRGVWNFLRQIDLAENTASAGAAQTVTADVVRIFTIHKSKGLEFPVVFLAQLGKRINLQDVANNLQLHAEGGIALRMIDRENGRRVKRDTLARIILSQRIRQEEIAEELRVLYVAMTRAQRRLVMSACVHRAEEKLAQAPQEPSAWQVLRCTSPVQWLLMGLRRARRVTLHAREAFLSPAESEEPRALPPFDPELLRQLDERLNWSYAHADAVRLAAKAAVSRVGKREDLLPLFEQPAFLKTKNTPAEVGTATHAALQLLPFGEPMDEAAVRTFLSAEAEAGRLAAGHAALADTGAIAWFSGTPLVRRAIKAARFERELSFSCPVPASALYDTETEESVLLQGVIDACFLENGAWTIVDYKTDRVRPGEASAEAAARHGTQLRLYALALAKVTGIPVRETLVVLLSHRAIEAVSEKPPVPLDGKSSLR